MNQVGQKERVTQDRVVKYFQQQLGYEYLGNWEKDRENSNIETEYLTDWLVNKQKVDSKLAQKAIRKLQQEATLGQGKKLYKTNKEVYRLLRYGVNVSSEQSVNKQTVSLIDWKTPKNNHFAIAEEVTVKGPNGKRPDVVLYVNGIALGVIELKRGKVNVSKGIQQNLDNQKKTFIAPFFTTMQLVMAGNDSQGLRYGTTLTPEKHCYQWREENPKFNAKTDDEDQRYLTVDSVDYADNLLDFEIANLCNKARFLEIIHDFIVFDNGTKKSCRHNQFFGVNAAHKNIVNEEKGIIFHTQGSGKSLTMVWLAKWVREHIEDARILLITDRTELDDQIEGVFSGVEETIYRCKRGHSLTDVLNENEEWLMCSLVHKFGRHTQGKSAEKLADEATDDFIKELKKDLPSDFEVKGKLFVFVDECHRTQSGKLHDAMKSILAGKEGNEPCFIGFTGTPLLKKDKKKSIEVFGPIIHQYRFDQAVADKVVLDIQYEARDVDQYTRKPEKIDEWFDDNTSGLSDMAKVRLKQRWGTMKKMLSSKDRIDMIVNDIWKDMKTKQRLMDGRGNAMLVCTDIYQACKIYESFNTTDLKGKCAIVTSYKPSPADIKSEETGEGNTEKLHQFDIYQNMLADFFDLPREQAYKKVAEFEKTVKELFIKEPGQMRLLIVVDKLLTGFDAPSASYLYIDKKMKDHGLFQAICRVNRLDGDDKEYGYIVDYKDLFNSLESSIHDYTKGAFEDYDAKDVQGLLTDRLTSSKKKLEEARSTVKALCEPVLQPKATVNYQRYFCGDVANSDDLTLNEPKRVALYRSVSALVRAYASLANEMQAAGYTSKDTYKIKKEVRHYSDMRDEIKLAAKDDVDLKQYEPAMRRLLDTYVKADDVEKVVDFEELGLIELIVEKAKLNSVDENSTAIPEAMAETIENNIRRIILDGRPINPRYYENMSELLDALIKMRREDALAYKKYLQKVKELAKKVQLKENTQSVNYPTTVDSIAKQSLWDNLGQDDQLVNSIHEAVMRSRKANWKGNTFKTKRVEKMVSEKIASYSVSLKDVMSLVEKQAEYD